MTGSKTTKVANAPGIYAYLLADGKTKRYAAMATFRGRQRWSQGHETIAAAKDDKARMLKLLKRERPKQGGDRKAGRQVTVGTFLTEWWLPTLPELTPGSKRAYESCIARVVAAKGTLRLRALDAWQVEELLIGLRAKKFGAKTQRMTFSVLKAALAQAVKRGLISENPCDDVDAPKDRKYKPPELETEDVRRLIRVADATTHGTLVYMAITTGMREERELFALRWAEVDFGTAQLRIPESKTEAGERALALGRETLERLRQHRLVQMARFEELKAPMPTVVFVDAEGRPWTQSRFWTPWNAIRQDAGFPTLHFHDLRHVQATLLARTGAHPSVMQRRLGHASSSMTMDVYTNTTAKDQAPAAEAVELLLAGGNA